MKNLQTFEDFMNESKTDKIHKKHTKLDMWVTDLAIELKKQGFMEEYYELKKVQNKIYDILGKIQEYVLFEEYKKVKTDKEFILDNGVKSDSIATLADDSGGRAQIGIDDGCYVLYIKNEDDTYTKTPWIFPEAFKIIKKLPDLPLQ